MRMMLSSGLRQLIKICTKVAGQPLDELFEPVYPNNNKD